MEKLQNSNSDTQNGTFPPYYEDFAEWTKIIPESEIRRLLSVQVPYYFGGGKPGALPINTFKKILYQLADDLDTDGIDILNYGPTGGTRSLREVLSDYKKTKSKLEE